MPTAPLRVVLLMEISLLSSAIAQVLARDPLLVVEVHPPGCSLEARDEPLRPAERTVGVAVLCESVLDHPVLDDPLLSKPVEIELHADGQVWVVDYHGLDDMAALLRECAQRDVAHAVRQYV